MNYTHYKTARDFSWEILIRERVCALPVSMSGLCRQMGIEVKYDDKVRLDDGCGVNFSAVLQEALKTTLHL